MLTPGCFAMMEEPVSFIKSWYAEIGAFFGLLSVEVLACGTSIKGSHNAILSEAILVAREVWQSHRHLGLDCRHDWSAGLRDRLACQTGRERKFRKTA